MILNHNVKKPKVFLGGTCNESKCRETIIPHLQMNHIDYFNPVVDDWTPSCMKREIEERKNCDYVLYTITPKMTGIYSIAEAVDDSNKKSKQTIVCLLAQDDGKTFNEFQMKSLLQFMNMCKNNGAFVCYTLDDVVSHIKTIEFLK